MTPDATPEERAHLHAALADPVRVAIVDALRVSDIAPVELGRRLDVGSNLLAHHLEVLEGARLIERSRSSGEGRRRYVHLRQSVLARLTATPAVRPGPALFVCTANSARSQLAAALWSALTGEEAISAGTHPAAAVDPGAMAAARRVGLDLRGALPRPLDSVEEVPPLVVTVCDRAHEELPTDGWLHWSITDPVPVGTPAAFDAAVRELRNRIEALADLAVAS